MYTNPFVVFSHGTGLYETYHIGSISVKPFSRKRYLSGRAPTLAFGLLASLIIAGVLAPAVRASVTLDVRVVRGGLDLDFGTVTSGQPSETEELELTFVSSGSAQYRVYQEFTNVLVNEHGARLPQGALLMQLSRGMNGTRGVDGIVPVTQEPQELFLSSPTGASDTLLVAYFISPQPGLAAGTYQGMLRFTVEARETGERVTQSIRVRAHVTESFRLTPKGMTSSRIRFGQLAPGERSAPQDAVFAIENNTAAPTQIIHELVEPLSNGKSDRVPEEALLMAVSSSLGTEPPRPATQQPDVVLTDERGTLQEFRLSYVVNVPNDQPAGTYRGTIRVRLTSSGSARGDEVLLPVELEISEVFTMSVKPADGESESLHFSSPPSGPGTVERRVRIEVQSNIGRPYQVLGGLDHPLVLPTGEALPEDALVLSITQAERGTVLHAPGAPVNVGYEPLYQSDAKGSPDAFLLIYRMTIAPDAKEGSYSGQIHYTITLF